MVLESFFEEHWNFSEARSWLLEGRIFRSVLKLNNVLQCVSWVRVRKDSGVERSLDV